MLQEKARYPVRIYANFEKLWLPSEILMAGLNGYYKILEADKLGEKPLYRSKGWRSSSKLAGTQEKGQKLARVQL